MKKIVAVVLVVLVFFSTLQLPVVGTTSTASAEETDRWVPVNNGLYGGIILSLAIDPTNTQIVYAGTSGGVFKSTNSGTSWTKMNNWLINTEVRSLAIDPTNPQIIYAGRTWGGVFKSTNGGTSWSQTGLTNTYVWSLAIDPTNPQTIYAGTYGDGVFKSTNGGTSWSQMNNGLTDTWVWSLAIDPTNTQTIYAGTRYGGVFKSTNGGTSWSEMNNGLTNTWVWSLAIDPTNPQTIYAGTYGGVFKSTNGGASWSQTGLTNPEVRALAIDPTNPQTIYAGTYGGGVFKSTNGGTSWSEMNNGLTNTWVYSLAIDPTNPQTIYAGTWGGGVFKSTNDGTSWSQMNNGLTDTWVWSLAIDPTSSQTIYAGTWGSGVFKSTNGGTSWSQMNNGLTDTWVFSLAIDSTNTQTIYAGTYGGVFKSTNGGTSWSQTGLTNTEVVWEVWALAIDPTNPQTIYAGTWGGGVFKSTNGGASWSQMNNGLTNTGVQSLAIDPTNTQTIYAGTRYGGVFKSTNGGTNWSQMNNGLTNTYVESLAIDLTNPQIIYAGTYNGGVFKSTNGGTSWSQMNNGLTNTYVESLAIDPTNPQTIYAGTAGVFKSTNGGTNWTKMNNGLTNTYVYSLAIDPTNPQTIYAGTWCSGVFKYVSGVVSPDFSISVTPSSRSVTPGSSTTYTVTLTSLNGFNNSVSLSISSALPSGVTATFAPTSVIPTSSGATSTLTVSTSASTPTGSYTITINASGGGKTHTSQATLNVTSITPPSHPQNLQANASASSIVLSWSPSIQGDYPIAGYAIYRGTTSGGESSTPIDTVPATITTYTDNDVTNGTTYYYYVEAYDNQSPADYSDPSDEVSAKVQNIITTGNYNFANISKASNEFQMWLDISINDQAPKDISSNYTFEVESGNKTGIIVEVGCEDKGLGTMSNSERYCVWFWLKINPQGQGHAAYFENGTIKMCNKNNPSETYTLNGLNNFSVYGTTFDVTKNAWHFTNQAWAASRLLVHFADKKHKEVYKAVDVMNDYIPESKRNKFWDSAYGFKWPGLGPGACYGMANAAIATFCNGGSDYWGTLGDKETIEKTDKTEWKKAIENHWNTEEQHATSPYKPFPEDDIYSSQYTYDSRWNDYTNSWTVEAVRKIVYYFVAQPSYKKRDSKNWVGEDKVFHFIDSGSENNVVNILKRGIPLSLAIRIIAIRIMNVWLPISGGHAIAITELIAWNNHRKYIIWDNNYPYLRVPAGYGPYEEWYIDDASDYNKSFSNYNGKYISFIKTDDGNGNHRHIYKLSKCPEYLAPSGDSQGIYGLGPYHSGTLSTGSSTSGSFGGITPYNSNGINTLPTLSSTSNTSGNTQVSQGEEQIQYPYPHHIEVLVIGGKVDSVKDKSTGEEVPLIPEGEIEEGKSTIITTTAGTFNAVYLPADKTYRIEATKFASMPFLKIYVTIPNGDGTAERLNYEHIEQSEDDATHVYFFVGKNNTDKSIKYIATSGTSNNNISSTAGYAPDYDSKVQRTLLPPTNFNSVYESGAIHLSWDNPDNANFAGVEIIRKEGSFPNDPTDGTLIYQGTNNQINDDTVSPDTLYFYAIYSKDSSSNLSDPAYTSIDTSRFSVYGNVTANGNPLEGASIEAKDSNGIVVGTGATDSNGSYTVSNLTNGNYTIDVSRDGYSFTPSEASITINNQNVEQNFSGSATPLLSLLFDNTTVTVGDTILLQWTYRNIDNGKHINIELNRGNSWETIANDIPILNGQYEWTVSGSTSNNATLRISLTENSSIYDQSNLEIAAIPPSTPQNLQVTSNATPITLTWDASAQGTYPVAGYAVYRGTTAGGESSTPIDTVSASVTTYTDNNVTQGTTYYYYVKAFDNQNPPNYSGSSNEVSATIPSEATLTLHIPSNWSLISVPFETDPSLLTSNANIQYLFYWDGTFWQQPITLQPGIGYLVYNTSSSEIDINLTGTPTSSPFTENATGNWQVIGNPFTTTSSLSSTSIITYIFYWDGNFWQIADPNNLQPGVGYLILTSSPGTLTFTKNP